MRRTYKYKSIINKTTEASALHWIELCRSLYNLCLEQRIDAYKQDKRNVSRYRQQNDLPALRKAFPEYEGIDAQCLQDVVLRLDRAYQGFFRRVKIKGEKAGFPRFKSKDRYDSFTLNQNSWKLDGKYLDIRNVGRFKLFLSRHIEGDIKAITIKRTLMNKWFVSFSCDNVPKRKFPETNKEVGIDVGIKSFCVDSDSNCVKNPKYFRKSERELRKRSRRLCRRKKGSNRRKKARLLVARVHEKVENQRKDFLHKVANYYIKNYKDIYVENLEVKSMLKNKYLSKSIADAGWDLFFSMLNYKAEEAGRKVIKVNPKGTSQLCSNCGENVPKTLAVRIHKCPHCGLELDRDLNASLNILNRGQADLSIHNVSQ